jgi:hypothetical protein
MYNVDPLQRASQSGKLCMKLVNRKCELSSEIMARSDYVTCHD